MTTPTCGHEQWTPGCVPCQTRHLSPALSQEYAKQTEQMKEQRGS